MNIDRGRFNAPTRNTHTRRRAIKHVVLRFVTTGPVAEEVRKRMAALPFSTEYEVEQREASLLASITCTPSQEQFVRRNLDELKITLSSGS
jgi:hypothetical protein